MKMTLKYILAIVCLYLSTTVYAQLESDQQDIIKEFEATLEDAERIQVKPIVSPVIPVKKTYKYQLSVVPLEIKYPDPVIKPLAAEPDEPFDSRSFYGKLGYGNVANPFLNIKFFNTDQLKKDFYIDLFHHSFDNTKNKPNQKMSNSNGKLGLNLRLKENQILAVSFNGGLEKRTFNGNGSDQVTPEFFGQTRNITRGQFSASFFNVSPSEKGISYKLKSSLQLLNTSLLDATELNAMLGADLNLRAGNWNFEIPVNFNLNNKKGLASLSTFNLLPHISKGSKDWYFDFGLNLNYDNKNSLKLWPHILVDYAINSKYLHAYVKSNQEIFTNNLNNLLGINPWMYSNFKEFSNNIAQTASLGVKGDANHLGYEGELGFKKIFNQASFTNLERNERFNFSPIDLNAVFIKGNIDLALSTNIKIGGQLIKNFYSKDVYGLHSFELTAFSNIDLFKEFLRLRPSFTLRDRTVNILKTGEVKGNNQVELNVGSQLQFSQKFSVYLDALNLLNNQYVPFIGYPNIGIHFNGGLLLRL